MCTGFDRSAYDVFQVFSSDIPLTLKGVMVELGDKRFFLFLGGGNTLTRFVLGLQFEGYLQGEESEGFKLTAKGEQKREELKQRVAV